MDSLYIAIPIIIVGLIIQIVDKFSNDYKEYIAKIPYLKITLFWLSVVLIAYGGYNAIDSLLKTKKFEVYASPSEIKLRDRINKDFVLKVSNNKNITVYDVNLSICLDNQSIDHSIIKIEPVYKEVIPNVPFSLMGAILSNGCSTLAFHSLSPVSSKEFYVRIDGETVAVDYRISFLVYDWALEPSLFNIPTTKEQFQSPPKNFEGFFDDKSADKEKTGKAWFQKWKAPINPYFPDQKESKLKSFRFYMK
jgi:hypothetical protein